jgi:chromosome segregation ATPase
VIATRLGLETRAMNLQKQLVSVTKALDESRRVAGSVKEGLEGRIREMGAGSDERVRRLEEVVNSGELKNLELEGRVKELSEHVEDMNRERRGTIDAHQSRIKQLQEKFMADLEAGKQEVGVEVGNKERRRMEERLEIERNVAGKREKELTAGFEAREKKFEVKIAKLWVDVEAGQTEYKKAVEDLEELDATCQKAIESLSTRLESVKAENKRLVDDKSKINALKQGQVEGDLVRSKDAEIAFLKNTVRIECEERMNLLAIVERLKGSGGGVSVKAGSVRASPVPVIASAAGSGRSTPKNRKKV